MIEQKRTVITGMAINTPLGDNLPDFLRNLLEGQSAVVRWKGFDSPGMISKVGGDLTGYDVGRKMSCLKAAIPPLAAKRMSLMASTCPWSTVLSVLMAADAFNDAGLFAQAPDPERVATVIAGHGINAHYTFKNIRDFQSDPGSMDSLFGASTLDTNHVGCVTEALGLHGPAYTVGAACASGNAALRLALDEIRHHGQDVALAVGAVYDLDPATLQGMVEMGAISVTGFNDEPARASRPFDTAREGFVPAHGGAVLVLEEMQHARERGARIYAELLGVEVNASAVHMPRPSEEHEARVMERVLSNAGVDPQEVDFVSAHATSTKAGDIAEIRAIKQVFGDHAGRLKINAPKSMLGHTVWAAAIVEAVAAVLQMRAGCLHPSINIDQLDPEIDLDVCANRAVRCRARCVLNNAFGFDGLNSAALIRIS